MAPRPAARSDGGIDADGGNGQGGRKFGGDLPDGDGGGGRDAGGRSATATAATAAAVWVLRRLVGVGAAHSELAAPAPTGRQNLTRG